MSNATIYSIARTLGVSASTVSRAFSRPDLVKDSVREQILLTARELGYEPNRAARGLATGQTGLIGLLIPDVTNPFFPPLIRAIERAASEIDVGVLLVDSAVDTAAEFGLVSRLRTRVDGLIVSSPRSSSAVLKQAVAGIPTVLVNRTVQGLTAVVCDNTVALQEAAQHLYDTGHRSFAVLRGPARSWAARRRVTAVRQWAAGTRIELAEFGPFEAQFEDGRSAAEAIRRSGATGVLAFDDLMACGVISGLADLGLSVPRDVSLVGCDDVLLARTLTPALTTVTAPVEDLGRRAVELLTRVASRESVADARLEGRFTLRGTTGPPSRQGTARRRAALGPKAL